MKITGETWEETHRDTTIKATRNTQEETTVIRRERRLVLECGHTVAARRVHARTRTQCRECQADETIAQEAATRLEMARRALECRARKLNENSVISYMRDALDELRFDIQRGYRPTLDEIDHLLGLLARPQAEDPGKAQSEGSKPADQ